MSGIRLNLEGQKFGRLTALHDVGSDGHNRLWKCLCDCGNFSTVTAGHLRAKEIRSCGCLQKEAVGRRAKEGLNRLPTGESNLNRVIKHYKYNTKKRNLKFSLTREQFKKLVQQKCFYCGVKPHTISNSKRSNGKFIYNGIDRVDNTKGYIIGNCVTCCRTCNEWKRARTQQEFLLQVKFIYENLLKG
ncbi:hypothetical protein KAR91_62420 [Candidatus Pacearchaeota archaeon]|nr:hypothetical protein [Candidatus Pacearchaeota archaeon]